MVCHHSATSMRLKVQSLVNTNLSISQDSLELKLSIGLGKRKDLSRLKSNTVWLQVSEMLTSQPNYPKKRKDWVSSSWVEEKGLLMAGVKGHRKETLSITVECYRWRHTHCLEAVCMDSMQTFPCPLFCQKLLCFQHVHIWPILGQD